MHLREYDTTGNKTLLCVGRNLAVPIWSDSWSDEQYRVSTRVDYILNARCVIYVRIWLDKRIMVHLLLSTTLFSWADGCKHRL